jgi:hypothetical protein
VSGLFPSLEVLQLYNRRIGDDLFYLAEARRARGLPPVGPNPHLPSWSTEEEDRLRVLIKDRGLTQALAGKVLEKGSASVYGKIRRMRANGQW